MTQIRAQRALPVTAAGVLVLLLAACSTPDPSFLVRSEQDCRSGDQQACAMLDDMTAKTPAVSQGVSTLRPQTQVQKDVDAVLQGMRRAHNPLPPPEPEAPEP